MQFPFNLTIGSASRNIANTRAASHLSAMLVITALKSRNSTEQ